MRKRAKPDATADKTGRQQIRRGEFGGIAVPRLLFVGQRLPQPVHRPLRHLAHDLADVLGPNTARSQPSRTIDIGLRHRPARIRLERQRIRHPAPTEIGSQRLVVAMGRVRKPMKQTVHALEHGARTDKSRPRQQRRPNAGLRRPARMQPLGPRALGEIFDDAPCHAAGDAERVHDLSGIETERRADARSRTHRTEDRGRVKPGLVDGLRHHQAQSAQNFRADGDADQRHAAVGIMPLAGCQHRRHYHRTGMHRTALESVVEILAMRRSTVDEGRACGVQGALMTDHRAWAAIVPARKRACDIILIARGHAQADDIDQQIFAFARGRRRQATCLQRHDLLSERFGDGGFWQLGCHYRCQWIKRGTTWCSAP